MRTLVKEVNGRKITFVALNASTLRVKTEGVADVEYSDKFKQQICTVTLNGDYRLTLHGLIKIPVEGRYIKYPVNDISIVNEKEFNLHSYKRNKTTTYLLPLLGPMNLVGSHPIDIPRGTQNEYSKYCVNTYLINAYIAQKKPKSIYLVYRFSEHPTYKTYETLLYKHPKFIKIHEHSNQEFIVFEMDLGEEYREDIKLLMKGKYSELNRTTQVKIMRFYNPRMFPESHKKIAQILLRHKEYREELSKRLGYNLPEEAELDDIPEPENEYLEYL